MERRESEAQAQAAVFDWARWEQSQTPVLKAMYHAANEGKRSVRAGADLKRPGHEARGKRYMLTVCSRRL